MIVGGLGKLCFAFQKAARPRLTDQPHAAISSPAPLNIVVNNAGGRGIRNRRQVALDKVPGFIRYEAEEDADAISIAGVQPNEVLSVRRRVMILLEIVRLIRGSRHRASML